MNEFVNPPVSSLFNKGFFNPLGMETTCESSAGTLLSVGWFHMLGLRRRSFPKLLSHVKPIRVLCSWISWILLEPFSLSPCPKDSSFGDRLFLVLYYAIPASAFTATHQMNPTNSRPTAAITKFRCFPRLTICTYFLCNLSCAFHDVSWT